MLDVILHTPQPRVLNKSIHATFFGDTIDLARSVNIYQHEETGCIFAKPKFLDTTYTTDYSGYNARLTLADFGNPSDWYEKQVDNEDNIYLERDKDGSLSEQRYTTLLTEPLGFVMAYYNYTSQEGTEKMASFGYVNPDTEQRLIQVEIYNDGQVYLTVKDVLVATGSLSANKTGVKYDIQDNWVRVGIIPNFMTYGILIIANTGAEVFYFDATAEIAEEELITNAKFYFVPQYRATYQFSKLGYLSDNIVVTKPYWFNNKPVTAQTSRTITVLSDYAPSYTTTLTKDDASTAYDDIEDLARVKVSFTTSDDTPFIYSINLYIAALFTTLSDESVSIIDYIKNLKINVPQDSTQDSVSLETKDQYIFDSLGANFYSTFYIADNGTILTHAIIEDLTHDVDIRYLSSKQPVLVDALSTIGILKQYIATDEIVLSGLSLEDAIYRIFYEAGIDSGSVILYSSGYTLPISRFAKEGFSFKIEIGENGVEALDRLIKTFASNYIYTFFPGNPDMVFYAGPPSFFINSVVPKFWFTDEIKTDIDFDVNLPTALAGKNIHIDYLPYEGNVVYVEGEDKVTKDFIQVFKKDYNSINPETVVSSRPINWVGSELPYSYQDKAINSLDIATRCCELLFGRINKRYRAIDFDSKIRFYVEDDTTKVLWKGNILDTDLFGLATIIGIVIDVHLNEQVEETTERNYIPCKYLVLQEYDTTTETWTNVSFI